MGIYDTVLVPCPKCGGVEYAQSKSGECELKDYALDDAPLDVLVDVNRHAPFQCERCSTVFEVNEKTRKSVECKRRPRQDHIFGGTHDW